MALVANWQARWQSFIPKNTWVLVIYLLALCCDAASTSHFMITRPDQSEELHPAVALTCQIVGPIIGPVIMVVVKFVLATTLAMWFRRYALLFLLIAAAICFWAAWYNLWGWQLYTPRLLLWLS